MEDDRQQLANLIDADVLPNQHQRKEFTKLPQILQKSNKRHAWSKSLKSINKKPPLNLNLNHLDPLTTFVLHQTQSLHSLT